MRPFKYLKGALVFALILLTMSFVKKAEPEREKTTINGVEITICDLPETLEFSSIYIKVDEKILGEDVGYIHFSLKEFDKQTKLSEIYSKVFGVNISSFSNEVWCGQWEVTNPNDPNSPVERDCCVIWTPYCYTETCACGYCCS